MKLLIALSLLLSMGVEAQTSFGSGNATTPGTVSPPPNPFSFSNPSGGSTFTDPGTIGTGPAPTGVSPANNTPTPGTVTPGTTLNSPTVPGTGTLNSGQLNTAPTTVPSESNTSDTFRGSLIDQNPSNSTIQSQEALEFNTTPSDTGLTPSGTGTGTGTGTTNPGGMNVNP